MNAAAATSPVDAQLPVWRDPAFRARNADIVAVLIAFSLPWSTSLVGIFCLIWLWAVAATLDFRPFLQSLQRPVSALPIALFVLALAGTLWSEASWGARLYALGPVSKLLVLPFLLYHFERSTRGMWVFVAFLVSCALLMALSWIVAFQPQLALKPDAEFGVPVKNYIDQSQEFALCGVVLAYPVIGLLRVKRWLAASLLAAIALSFILNMVFVTISRTAMVTFPVTLLVFALLHLKWRSVFAGLCLVIILAGTAWIASTQLQQRTSTFLRDYQLYKERNLPTSIGLRLEFWKKSLVFFGEAPVIGHGTGSIRGLFDRAAVNRAGVEAATIGNPHNQTLNVAIQWGIVGVALLYAMWLCHLLIFRGEGLVAWIGLIVVAQNISTSLFNSHLFDFNEGWMYVLGVGVAGGMGLGSPARSAIGTGTLSQSSPK